jgi:bifunctional DNase/RNase
MLSVDLVGIQMDPSSGAAVLVLREHEAPNRLLPIVVGGAEATSIAIAASGKTLPRPMTHDLMVTLVDSLDAQVDAVELTELRDGSYRADLALSGPMGERRLDTRPSDAIALAVRTNAPLFVSEQVLDEAGKLPVIELDDHDTDQNIDPEQIDAEVDQFREFLSGLDPADFVTATPPSDSTDPSGPALRDQDADFADPDDESSAD